MSAIIVLAVGQNPGQSFRDSIMQKSIDELILVRQYYGVEENTLTEWRHLSF